MREHLLSLTLFILLLALLWLAPAHPWTKWQWPCMIFCVAALFWLAPETASALRWLISLAKVHHQYPAELKCRPRDEEIYEKEAKRRRA